MSVHRPLWRWPPLVFWTAAAIATGIFGVSLPQLESIGYEHSLFTALFSAMGAGHLAAAYPARARALSSRGENPVGIASLYARALCVSLVVLSIPLAASLINGLRVPFCNLSEGLVFYFLMPGWAVVISSAIGLVCGLLTSRPIVAALFFFALYCLGLLVALISFWESPAVFIFNPFFGYFPGVLYDRLVEVDQRLLTYRVSTALQVAAILSAASLMYDRTSLRLGLQCARPAPRRALTAVSLLGAALAMHMLGPYLGHRVSRGDLERRLSARATAGRLDLFFPEETPQATVDVLSRDAEFSLSQVERYLRIRSSNRIAVFFFADSADKSAAIGAAETNVAKPWRNEVYVLVDEAPHEVLRHELAHVVIGEIGAPPFSLAASAFGLLPNPGLIEGVAVAAQGPRGDLTVHQWAASMLEAGLLPPLDSLFSLGFLNLPARRAYTAAGSFTAWLVEIFGPETLKLAYHTADIEEATGKSLRALEKEWRAYLVAVPRSERDVAAAKFQFDRPSIIGSVCVHEVERMLRRARSLSAAGSHKEAISLFEAAHEKSNGSVDTMRELFFSMADAGDVPRLGKEAERLLKNPSVSAVDRHIIREILTDLDFTTMGSDALFERYSRLAAEAKSDSDRRRLEAKAHLAAIKERVSSQLFDILSLRPRGGAPSAVLSALIIADALASNPEDPVLAYLHARQYYLEKSFAEALASLDRIDSKALAAAAPSLVFTFKMMRGESLFNLRRFEEAKKQLKEIANDSSARLGQRDVAKDWVARVGFEVSRR